MQFDLRAFTDRLCRYQSTAGNETPAAEWIQEQLDALGFETYAWEADAALLSTHPSFPDDPAAVESDGRLSVAGAFAFGDATLKGDDGYPTLVLNGHIDVVPADLNEWETDPFEPTRRGAPDTVVTSRGQADDDTPVGADQDGAETLTARGAADMKSGVAACLGAALDLRDAVEAEDIDLDGRVVVEAVAGEEDGGYGAATAALQNPYPFDRDAAIIAEPTELRPVIATGGSLMARLELEGKSAHAASRWVGEDVLPRFEHIRGAFMDLEAERCDRVTHPLYEEFPIAWPVVCGTVKAGSWASTVPASLEAEFRIGVAPGETVDEVEAEFRQRLQEVVKNDEWLGTHPPRFERFSVQFEAAETAPDEPIVETMQDAMAETGLSDIEPRGATYGADSRHYVKAGIPTVLFGPGTIEEAHYPDETIQWSEVEQARETITVAARRFLGNGAEGV